MKLSTLFLICTLLGISLQSFAQAPNTLSYQGLLTTSGGTPVPDGTYKLQFDLFTVSTGGVSFWTEVDSLIAVQRGTFSLILGNSTVLPDSFHRPLFIQVTALAGPGVGSPTTFSPRSALTSSPSALSLKTPMTLTDSADYPGIVFTVSDKGSGFAIGGYSLPNLAYGAGTYGTAKGSQGNGVWGSGYNGNQAYGVVGLSDTGYGTVGVSWYRRGTALIGYNEAIDGGPLGIGVQSHGQLVVEGVTGDSAVQLPDNSIDAREILDEPGISQGTTVSFSLSGLTSMTNIDSTTITIPANGYVVLFASALASLYNTTTTNWMAFQITDASMTTYDGNNYSVVGPVGSTTTNFTSYFPSAIQRTFYKTKGTYKFYFEANDASGTGTKYFWNIVMTAMYFPTSYGPVVANVPQSQLSGFKDATLTSTRPPLPMGRLPFAAGYNVDLRELEVKEARLEQETQKVENEILKAKLNLLKREHESGHGR